jgi:hypothetical protein
MSRMVFSLTPYILDTLLEDLITALDWKMATTWDAVKTARGLWAELCITQCRYLIFHVLSFSLFPPNMHIFGTCHFLIKHPFRQGKDEFSRPSFEGSTAATQLPQLFTPATLHKSSQLTSRNSSQLHYIPHLLATPSTLSANHRR